MATVRVNMNMCDAYCYVTVTKRDDGDLDVDIQAHNCEQASEYGRNLKLITMDDIIDFGNSKINDVTVRGNLSPHCLIPSAVFDAAWLEMGMISKSLVKNVQRNTVEFVDDNGESLY